MSNTTTTGDSTASAITVMAPQKLSLRMPFLSGRIPLGRTSGAGTNETVATEVNSVAITEPDQSGVESLAAVITPFLAHAETVTTEPTAPDETLAVTVGDTEKLVVESLKEEVSAEKEEKESETIREISVPQVEEQKAVKNVELGLHMIDALGILKKKDDELFSLKELDVSPAVRTLMKRRGEIALTMFPQKEKLAFCLTFLTAVISRSSLTLVETSFLVRPQKEDPLPFLDKLISVKQAAWDEMKGVSSPDETAAILALAPLLTLYSLRDAFYLAMGGVAVAVNNTVGKDIEITKSADTENVIQVGEDIWTVTRDQLKKILPNTSEEEIRDKESSFNALIKAAVEEIHKNGRAYGIEGGVRMLIAGTTINRKAIYELLLDIQKRGAFVVPPKVEKYTAEGTGNALIAGELNALQSITGGTGIAAPLPKSAVSEPESTMSAVDESNGDAVKTIFMDDPFVRIVKLICKVDDITNLENCFKKHASLTMKDFNAALLHEEPLIQSEVASFLTWAKNSYLKEKIPVLNSMTLLLVLTTVERGVGGALTNK